MQCKKEGNKTTTTSHLLRTSAEQLRLETGYGGQLTDIPDPLLECVTNRTWLSETIKFMKNIKMGMDDSWGIIPYNRQGDAFLMSLFLQHGYKGHLLYVLNQCRLQCRVVLLSDIITGDGRFIQENILQVKPLDFCHDNFDWPRPIPYIPEGWQDIWNHAILQVTAASNRLYAHEIANPLGRFINYHHNHWRLWFDGTCLFHQVDNLWHVYRRHQGRRRTQRFCFDRYTTQLPSCYRATGKIVDNDIIYTGHMEHAPPPPQPNDFWTRRRQLPEGLRWAIGQIALPDNLMNVVQAIQQELAVGISDGSYKEPFGTSAFTMGSEISKLIAVNMVPGDYRYHSAYRAELSGVAGILTCTLLLCETFQINHGKITIGFDGKSAMDRLNHSDSDVSRVTDFDLLKLIRHLIDVLPIRIEWHWVEGHQDDHKPWEELDHWAQHNILMDNLAKSYWVYCNRTSKRPFRKKLEGEGCALFWNQRKLSHFNITEIYDEYYGDVTGDYWINKRKQLKDTTIHTIDWSMLQKATHQLPFQRRLWLSQHLVGMMGVNKWLHRWKREPSDLCPICKNTTETARHVLTCNDARVTTQWELSLSKLEWQLDKLGTPTSITKVILQHLQKWRNPNTTMDPIPDALKEAVQAQQRIGWENILYGRLSYQWQQAYAILSAADSITKTRRWTQAIILKLTNIAWDFWEHRNAIKHSTDHPDQLRIRQELRRDIITEFRKGTQELLAEDRHRLHHLERVLALPLEQQQQWKQSMEAARHRWEHRHDHHEEEERPSLTSMRASMRAWLRPGN